MGAETDKRLGMPIFEALEPRLLLSGTDFYIASLTPAGDLDHPFDQLEVGFTDSVNSATFGADDVQLVGPGGAIVPISDPVMLAVDRFLIDFGELTGMHNYSLVVGSNIEDTAGQKMDQDRDGAPGEIEDDTYDASLFAASTSIGIEDILYDDTNVIVSGSTLNVWG